MEHKPDWIGKRQALRTEAEEVLAGVSSAELAVQPAEVLLRELLVHKVELEMQVEELRRTQVAMEEARDRYVDLYDFAPLGYVTLNRDCLISEINLTGATQLGVERGHLVGKRFATFVAPHDRDRWHRLFMTLMGHADPARQAFILNILRADGSTFRAHLDAQRRDAMGATPTPPALRLAVIDISKIRQTEAESGSGPD